MDVLEKVTAVVAEVLELEPAEVGPDAQLIEDLGMDSVLAIDVATALEKHYKIKVPDEQMEALTTPRAIAGIVETLLAAKA
jgi:acyl carrier protein